MTIQFQEEKSQHRLDILRRKEEEDSIKTLADRYGIPSIDLAVFPIDLDALRLIPEERSRSGELVVFNATGKHLKIAIKHPDRPETQAILKRLEGDRYTYELYLVSTHSLELAWESYKRAPKELEHDAGTIQVSNEKIAALQNEITNIQQIKERIEQMFYSRTTEALEVMLAGAIAVDASDLHIESQEEGARLRFRLDGVLHDVAVMPLKLYTFLLSRIKLISELKLNVHDRAQDGRFTIRVPVRSGDADALGRHSSATFVDTEVRTSTLPGPNGENLVLRILNPASITVQFYQLGMQPWVTETMEEELRRPNGMILTTGPTGSGKTTTLYTFLQKIHSPETKIITIEDPIEYHLAGIEQTQTDPEKGYDFPNGLRAIVRQDPDVILVGEIRDYETADTAINAALTGHLVFSTLHTNNAAGAIPRLITLGIKPESIAPALNITMAQRLVRKVCTRCRAPIVISEELHEKIRKELAAFPQGVPMPDPSQWTIYIPSPTPCNYCTGGYKGRVAVFEIIRINEDVEALMFANKASEYELRGAAERQGQITMRQDGVLKILAGITDFDEVERVVGT